MRVGGALQMSQVAGVRRALSLGTRLLACTGMVCQLLPCCQHRLDAIGGGRHSGWNSNFLAVVTACSQAAWASQCPRASKLRS
jgi:hypothetical protein